MDRMPATLSAAVASAAPPKVLRPESLHPALWLGHQLGRHAESAVPSGFAPLDAQLPGRGWPRRALTELLCLIPASAKSACWPRASSPHSAPAGW